MLEKKRRNNFYKAKGNGGKRSAPIGHRTTSRFNDLGIFYADGMGCYHHINCFTCPYNDCIITDSRLYSFMANVGNGITPF